MTDKQPEIYSFIEKKFTEARTYNDLKFSEIFDKVNLMKTDIEVIKQRERPGTPCRELISEIIGMTEQKCKEVKTDVNNVAQELRGKVDWGWFKWLISAAFGLAAGAYAFAWILYWRLTK